MPPFSPEIQSLIKGMLTVDVSQRFTIEQIKAHPAFRRQISPQYVLPTPLPIRTSSAPIDEKTLTAEELAYLGHIGFTDQAELIEELHSPEETSAKVFLHMYEQKLDLEMLPWESAHQGPLQDNQEVAPTLSLDNEDSTTDGAPSQRIPRENPLMFGQSPQTDSIEIMSLAARPEWAISEAQVSAVLVETPLETFCTPIYQLMCSIESYLGQIDYQWFHPDLVTLYLRKSDATIYMSIVGEFRTTTDVTIKVRLHKGDPDVYDAFLNDLKSVLNLV